MDIIKTLDTRKHTNYDKPINVNIGYTSLQLWRTDSDFLVQSVKSWRLNMLPRTARSASVSFNCCWKRKSLCCPFYRSRGRGIDLLSPVVKKGWCVQPQSHSIFQLMNSDTHYWIRVPIAGHRRKRFTLRRIRINVTLEWKQADDHQ